MPSSQEILAGLGAIADGWRWLAIAWHVVLGLGLIALVSGWRPEKRIAGVLLAVPAASVSTLAWSTGNPFNGTTFALMAAGLAGVSFRLPRTPIRVAVPWLAVPGAFFVAFGWTYPHFLETGSWLTYLYASPMGLIPCPTLSAVVGIGLVVEGLDSRGWSLILGAGGIFYGLFGWLRLGVGMDVVLLVGAFTLAVAALVGFGRRRGGSRGSR